MNGLNHNALTCSAVPIPPWEHSLQTVEAQPYFNVSQASLVLEGIVFDRNNNLLFVDVATGRVFKLTPERQLSIVLKENSFGASGLAVHKDGRIFIASVGDMQRGSVRAIEPNGTREQMIVAPNTGFLVNDLVFDNQGGFYFTDSRGNSADPQGGVFYVSPNVGSIHAILPGLAVGNGIAIDPAGSQIWATEHAKNRLHRVRLSDATTVAPFGSVVTYQFTGPAPDGARVDSEGNVYVAISGQGRVMVFNRNGLPIGQIVLPDRDKGRNLKSTSLAIFNVSQASLVLEGIVFDRNNNLLFVDVATGRVFKLTPERQLSIVLKENSFGASGLAVHKDGRIFIASVGDMQRGSVRAIEPNGTREQMIVAPNTGFLVNDLVFDNQGGFYFTDSRGNSADPQGGVFYVSPNVGSIHAILPGLAVGNGIAIDPAGSQIWATEHAKNRLHRVRLSDATTVAPFGSVVTYQFTGPAPDGARVDSEGNVYVAISGQGRVMVFNRNGLPIGQIVLPDRDKGRNLKSTSLAIRPGHRELFIVANSGTEPGGAMIFRSGAFAPAPFFESSDRCGETVARTCHLVRGGYLNLATTT